MSTRKFKFGNANDNKVKAGKNNTRTILTAAGIIAAGGGGYAAGRIHGEDDPDAESEEQIIEEQPEKRDEKLTEEINARPNNERESQQTTQQTQSQNEANIAEPQPTDTTSYTNNEVQELVETDPNLIAQQIIAQQDIGPDIDNPAIIFVDDLATIYREDGSEMLVAVVHTSDGAQYLLADYDGDGYFTDVFDLEGNYLGEAEGNLMASDLEAMIDDTGNYLALDTPEPQGDDPTNDIINTPNPTQGIVGNSVTVPVPNDDEISAEELLAQLRENEDAEDEHLVDESDDVDDIDNDVYDVDNEDIYG